MKSLVWSYEDKKPYVVLMDRYHYIENKKQLNKLIDRLLNIDAVSIPEELTFPVMLEVLDGFAPTLVKADIYKMRQELKKLQEIIDKASKMDKNNSKAIKPRKTKEKVK